MTDVVPIRLTRPSVEDLRPLVDAGRSGSLTYEPVGISHTLTVPTGYRLDRWSRVIGTSNDVFERACEAIRTWQIHRGAGLVVCADEPPTVDAVVALCAPLPIGYIDIVCRVVTAADLPDRFGFAYGTLSVHPEQGEESFTVIREADGTIVFEIVAVSRPRHFLARALPPVARILQRRATARYLDAMTSVVTT
ncbi:MAG TPA: DUF1990 domain-containing protein [Ilumatobacteraceae bacterium]|nr:DUF1990 domain-containing protein [Ilumatobacteraceae bacterium]HRB03816.1 DUF1990 domain-containing protein [Ilumatobacteraceae bacterium]